MCVFFFHSFDVWFRRYCVWLYFLRLFDWCRLLVLPLLILQTLKFTCIENRSRYILNTYIHNDELKKMKHTSRSKNCAISTLHTPTKLNTLYLFFFSFLCDFLLYIHELLCALCKSKSKRNWWNVWLFMYVAKRFMYKPQRALTLSCSHHIIAFIFICREQRQQQEQEGEISTT